MGWLFDNPIANMYGPDFIVWYAGFCLAVLAVLWITVQRSDRTGELPGVPAPGEPDPYQLAYLRGGENEAARLLIFDLYQRGYLERRGLMKLERSRQADPAKLSPVERQIFDWYYIPRESREVFGQNIPSQISRFWSNHRMYLITESLITAPSTYKANLRKGIAAAAAISGLGAYKLTAALSTGHANIGFLVIACIVAVGLVVVLTVKGTSRITRRGREYIGRIQNEYRLNTGATPPKGDDGLTLLFASLFGFSALTATPFADFDTMFAKSRADGTAAGCGGGGGSGSDGGGGGCGGCGGS